MGKIWDNQKALEGYLGPCQTSTIELSRENSWQLKTANYYYKTALSLIFSKCHKHLYGLPYDIFPYIFQFNKKIILLIFSQI